MCLYFNRRARRAVAHVEVFVDALAARHALRLREASPVARAGNDAFLVALIRVERDGEPPPVLQGHAVRVREELGDDHLAFAHLVVHDAAEEHSAFLGEVHGRGGPRPRPRRETFFLLLFPLPGFQIEAPQVAVRHALLHVPVLAETVARVLAVPAVHEQSVAVRGDVRGAPRAGTNRLGPAAAGAVLPGHGLQRELPDVVVVPDLVPGVVEPAEKQQALALGVRDHPVAAARGRAAAVG